MNYREHLKELRKSYYSSYPQQRLNVALQRIENPEHGPNILVTYVSAIEGLLRSLVMWGESGEDRPSPKVYERYKFNGVLALYSKYCEIKECKDLVSHEVLELVGYAVEYRNLLAHECTYLGQDKYPELVNACQQFLEAISTHAGLKKS